MFIQNIVTKPEKKTDDSNTIRIVLPFKDQIATNAVFRQLHDLVNKIAITLHSVFVSQNVQQNLKSKEINPSIVSQHCVVYKFACDLCDKNLNEDQFCVLKKCYGKFDCPVYEMLFIKELRPSLNTQSDSISAKLFV